MAEAMRPESFRAAMVVVNLLQVRDWQWNSLASIQH